MKDSNFKEHLLVKLLHDISSNVSVVYNMTEFMSEDARFANEDKIFSVLKSSAYTLIAKLNFFKEFYNTSKYEELKTIGAMYSICSSAISEREIELSFSFYQEKEIIRIDKTNNVTSNYCVENWVSKMILGIMFIVAEFLYRKGRIDVMFHDHRAKKISITVIHNLNTINKTQNDLLLTSNLEVDTSSLCYSHSNCVVYYILDIMRKFNANIQINYQNNIIEYIIDRIN